MKNEQEIIDEYYEKLHRELSDVTGDDLVDLSITVTDIEGRTYTRSWHDREKRIQERDWDKITYS